MYIASFPIRVIMTLSATFWTARPIILTGPMVQALLGKFCEMRLRRLNRSSDEMRARCWRRQRPEMPERCCKHEREHLGARARQSPNTSARLQGARTLGPCICRRGRRTHEYDAPDTCSGAKSVSSPGPPVVDECFQYKLCYSSPILVPPCTTSCDCTLLEILHNLPHPQKESYKNLRFVPQILSPRHTLPNCSLTSRRGGS